MQFLTYAAGHWQIQYFLSSPLVSSFLFAVVSVPITDFSFDTNDPQCSLVQNTGSCTSVLQYTGHTLIHNSCDIDWRVWCCWHYFVINKSRIHYLVIGKSWCLGHWFKNYMNCLALRWPIKALFPLCFWGRFQVSLPGLQEAKHTTLLQCCPVGVVSAFHSSRWIFALTLRTFHSH